jgi:uncharacterized protein YecT (DUF1311 family)
MHIRPLSTTLAIVGLIAAGCDDGTKEQSPGEVLARDSMLATDLKQADTSAFAEAADVAMAFDPDSAAGPATAPSTRRAPPPAVPMRVDRAGSSSPPARAPMRPEPATIHPDPLPSRTMPPAAAPSRATTSSRSGTSMAASAVAILEQVPGAAIPAGAVSEPCASPVPADQRRCLMVRLARSDVSLDRTYQALIADLKREAGAPPGAPEPASVQELRRAQRAWLVYRDTECRRRNRDKEGVLWAPLRAQCLGEFSGLRAEELARARRR